MGTDSHLMLLSENETTKHKAVTWSTACLLQVDLP